MTLASSENEPAIERSTARAYSEWLVSRAGESGFDPYYAEEVARFELRDGDVLIGSGDVTVRAAPCGSLFESVRAGASTTVCGLAPRDAIACVGAIDGARGAREASVAAAVAPGAWSLFIDGTFGKLVFAPRTLAELEARVSHAEIVRFPGSPYEIVRAYWENMADVRARVEAAFDETGDARRFARLLRELNVLSHVGESGRSFYRPASPIVGKGGVEPGAFWLAPSVTEGTSDGVRFVSGPRVGAALIGGERYQSLLASSVGDSGALDAARELTTSDGLAWGSVVTARADSDEHAAPWFCPPRPFGAPHFEAIFATFSAARTAARDLCIDDAVRSAASLHWRLVRLHPFMSGNQSVAMGLVNGVLRVALGAGMPHLVLDHLALRLTLAAYERVFARAVSSWLLVDESAVHRALELAARRRRVFRFLEALRDVPGSDVEAFLGRHREDAALALLASSI